MGLLPETQKCGLRMRWECRERFPRHRLQRKPLVIDPDMHHDTCVTANPRWRGKRTRHCRRMRNPQFYVSGKRPMGVIIGLPWYHRSKLAVYLWFDNNVLWHDLHVKFWLGNSKSLCRILKVRSRIFLSCLLCHENATPESSGWNYEWCISTSNWYI